MVRKTDAIDVSKRLTTLSHFLMERLNKVMVKRNDETTVLRTRIEELERRDVESQTTITGLRGEISE